MFDIISRFSKLVPRSVRKIPDLRGRKSGLCDFNIDPRPLTSFTRIKHVATKSFAQDWPRTALHRSLLYAIQPGLKATYPREATIAEKLYAMVVPDIRNSRPKDFYHVWRTANARSFDMASLHSAMVASFKWRGSKIPIVSPFALTEESLNDPLNDPQKKLQWNAFVSRLNPGDKAPSLGAVGAAIRSFLPPCVSGKFPDTSQDASLDSNSKFEQRTRLR
jgi:hypothetical protein